MQGGTVCFVHLDEKNWVTYFNDMQQVIETGLGNVTRAWIGWIENLRKGVNIDRKSGGVYVSELELVKLKIF